MSYGFGYKDTRALVACAMGRQPADIVIRDGQWVCVQSGEILPHTDIAILGRPHRLCRQRCQPHDRQKHGGDRSQRAIFGAWAAGCAYACGIRYADRD